MNHEHPSHPPRPGIRRLVRTGFLETPERRREFAAAVRAIVACGLAPEVAASDSSGEPQFTLYCTRRVRTTRTE